MKTYYRQIAKWTFIGLALRLALMPSTMHGQDILFINYFPMMFVKNGIWDPYGFIRTNFSYFPYTYYGPVLFMIIALANFIFIKIFNAASLIKMLEIASAMMFKEFGTVDYVNALSSLDLSKNLFLMKTPYLVFDLLIGVILLKLAISREAALKSYIFWMLNIVVLHSTYAIGQTDIIVAFFVTASLYAAIEKRPYLSIILLSLGGAIKILPYVLILPTSLLLGRDWEERFSLIFTAGAVSLFIYLPFYLSSNDAILGFFALSKSISFHGWARWLMPLVFVIMYSLISVNAVRDSRSSRHETILLYYFLVIIFLNFATSQIRFRHFVIITPLLAFIIPRHKRFGIFIIFIIAMLAFLWLSGRDLQFGLLTPINPMYFHNLPSINEIMGRFVDLEIIYKIIARALPLAFMAAAAWVWRIKSLNHNV